MNKTAIITGASGQDSFYLSSLLLSKGYTVVGLIRRNSTSNLERLQYIIDHQNLILEPGDLTDFSSIERIIKRYQPDEFYNLGAMSQVRESFDIPITTANITGMGALNCLEAIRLHKPDTKFYQASSSVAGDTPVLIRQNDIIKTINIEDLFSLNKENNLYLQEAIENTEVLSINKDFQVKFCKVKSISKHPKPEIYIIKYAFGGNLKVTGDHSVAILDKNGNLQEKKVSELNNKDYLVTFNGSDIGYNDGIQVKLDQNISSEYKSRTKNYIESVSITPEIMRLIGYYVAEGHCDNLPRREKISFTFHIKEDNYARDVIDLINKYFPELHCHERMRIDSNSRTITVSSKILCSIMEQFGCNAHEKHIANWVWTLSKEYILDFLRGYIGDANIKSNKNEIKYTTVSKQLMQDLIYLLSIYGLNPKVITRFNKEHLSPQGTIIKDSCCYDIYLSSQYRSEILKDETIYSEHYNKQSSIKCLPTKLFFHDAKIAGILGKFQSKPLMSKKKIKRLFQNRQYNLPANLELLLNSKIGVLKIRDISKAVNDKPVYDLCVPESQHFIGGNIPILLHNSEMFGNQVTENGVTILNENSLLIPRSPYGVSKVFAHQMTRNYREAYGLFACAGILMNHESQLRGEMFVTRKITKSVAQIYHNYGFVYKQSDDLIEHHKKFIKKIKFGNLDSKRDWGHAADYVRAMWLMLQQDKPDDFVIATGETHSCREFLELSAQIAGVKNIYDYIELDTNLCRPTEIDILIGDSSKAKKILGWKPIIKFEQLVEDMTKYDLIYFSDDADKFNKCRQLLGDALCQKN